MNLANLRVANFRAARLRVAGLVASVFALVFASPCFAEGQGHRQLGAHEHGHGRMNIAVEGKKLTMELEMPADDAVGFEHEPRTPEQKATIASITATLEKPLEIFILPAAAKCRSVKATSEFAKHGEGHMEMQAVFKFECGNMAELTQIEFKHFKIFPRAKELEVGFIGVRGQKLFEVTPDQPSISIKGL